MRVYLGIIGVGVVHIFERSFTAYGNGDIGLCDDAYTVMGTRARDCPLEDYVPTCIACVVKESRARSRD